MSEKHLPYIGGNFNRIVFDGDGSTWVREQLDTRYYELFGTPERAARTLVNLNCDGSGCDGCSLGETECDLGEDALLDWMKGASDGE